MQDEGGSLPFAAIPVGCPIASGGEFGPGEFQISSLYVYFDRMRVDAVSDHNQIEVAYRHTRRHFEVGVVNLLSGCHTHRCVVESATEVDFLRGRMSELYQRIVGRHLGIVAIADRLGQPVQLAAPKLVRMPPPQ